ncbi:MULTISPECIES: winged helix-turn-helix domain-containing protein [unclassified Nocardia]|uniref:winged helix-turn-helix domain-containing protein n=1 Tax=unclassified Nocardia TaxID=2637762 RepID=UPI001CE40E79|nr:MULTISPECIES: winged helix-turn-helix domain-containing protein [unclassified Nocardia]
MSTTALALAAAWPGPEAVIVLEADPRGGTLAASSGGDPRRGLASLTATAGEGRPLDLAEHLQRHPSGVAYLAAPRHPEDVRTALAHPIPIGPGPASTQGRDGELVVIADCGIAAPDSVAAPLVSGADLLLVVVHARQDDIKPAELGAAVRALARWCPRLGVVLIGAQLPGTGVDLGAALLGTLPPPEWTAGAPAAEHDGVDAAARALAAAVRTRASADTTTVTGPVPRAHKGNRSRGGRARIGRHHSAPRVYGIGYRHFVDTSTPLIEPEAAPSSTTPGREYSGARRAEPITASHPESSARRTSSPQAFPAPCNALPGVPTDPSPVLEVRVFGPLRVLWRPQTDDPGRPEIEITARLQRRSRELLALLATHPHGLTRGQLIEALWGQRPPHRPTNAVHTTLTRLRATLAKATGVTVTRLLAADSVRYRLDPAIVSTDYAAFADAVAQRRRAVTDTERRTACQRILDLAAPGVLAADLDADWLYPIRQAARRDATTALGALAALLVTEDPRATLHLLETVLDNIDPVNEHLYRDILRLHARLGEYHAIDHTVELLAHHLAGIGEKPSRETLELARHLHRKI